MSMFSRMTDIVQANINAILDKAEDPYKVIRLIIQEMEETLVEVRSVAARSIADKKELTRKQTKLAAHVKDWQSKATLAMKKDREDLARAALIQKHQAQSNLDSLSSELATVEESIGKLQEDTASLHEKLAEAKTRQKSLALRKNSAVVMLKVKTNQHVEKIDDAIARFEQYERKIEDIESQVEAYDLGKNTSSLSSQFQQLEADESIEKELESLRKKVA
jgi:phage shock protein A